MINVLTGIGYGIIGFAVLIGIGIVLLGTLGGTVSSCSSGYTWNTTNSATYCCNQTAMGQGSACAGANASSPSTATSTINTVTGYLGTSSGGLASFLTLVIIIVIGLLFLGMFMTKKGKQY